MAKAEAYVKKEAGEIIRADDWNEMQSRARDEILGHRHTGGGQGALLKGDAIDPESELRVKSVAAQTLTVAGEDLSARLKALLDQVNAALPLAGGRITGELTAAGGLRLPPDRNIWLRDGDENHGLGFYGGTKVFAGVALDGPVLHGFNGGGLGSKAGTDSRLALTWNGEGKVTVLNELTVAKKLTVSDLLAADNGIQLNNKTLWLRAATDARHGLGFCGGASLFAGTAIDGPVLFGNSAGGLGSTKDNVQKLALTWDGDENVAIGNNLTVAGKVITKAARKSWAFDNEVQTSSRSWETLANMSQSFESTGGKMLLMFNAGGVQTAGGLKENNVACLVRLQFRMLLDKVERTRCVHEFHHSGWALRDVVLTALVDATAAKHDVEIQWSLYEKSSGEVFEGGKAVCSLYQSQRVLTVIEL